MKPLAKLKDSCEFVNKQMQNDEEKHNGRQVLEIN